MSIDNLSSSMEEKVISTKELFEKIDTINNPMSEDSDIKRSNGNINGQSVMGKMLQMGAEASKIYALNKLLPKRFARAHQDGDIHIHDLDFYPTKTTTCLQIPLGEMLKNGVWNEHGFLRPPKSIATAAALAAIVMQSSQNQFHGGQSFPSFDFDLAPFVTLSFEKHKEKIAKTLEDLKPECEHEDYTEEIEKEAWEATEKETLQAMEGFVHNLNTMHSRAGAQVVFSSVNFGLDTSKEGRLISKCLMQAQCNGLGKHETPIFPILVFKVKDGVNGLPGDPNYDLFEQSIEVTSKRLFPNWIFEDAPFNLYSYNKVGPEKSVATMGAIAGHEVVTVRLGDKEKEVSIESFFNYIKTQDENVLEQKTNQQTISLTTKQPFSINFEKYSEYIDLSDKEIYILDSSEHWTKVYNIWKNEANNCLPMMKMTYKIEEEIHDFYATIDHPIKLESGEFMRMDELGHGDEIQTLGGIATVESVYYCKEPQDSYDVQTASGEFIASNIFTHNCRTRLCTDVFEEGDGTSTKRGNASFTSINMPRLALRVMDIEDEEARVKKFYKLLDNMLELVHDQLLERYHWQCSAQPEEFAYLYNNNAVVGSDKWHETGNTEEYVKHYSLSIGFIGLAETLKALIGEHHGESEKAQNLGLEIIKHMRDYCDQKAVEEHLNWSLLGTPAEGLAGRFTKIDQKRYGIIPGVTDREYYTNSSHCPVYYNISIKDKINKEAPYHALENAGHICYIELDGDPSHNLEAVKQIVNQMKQAGIGYGAINHPVDTCRDCRYQGCNMTSCPVCGSTNISYLRRITGYLVGTLDRWNDGKKAEERDRVKHT